MQSGGGGASKKTGTRNRTFLGTVFRDLRENITGKRDESHLSIPGF